MTREEQLNLTADILVNILSAVEKKMGELGRKSEASAKGFDDSKQLTEDQRDTLDALSMLVQMPEQLEFVRSDFPSCLAETMTQH